LATAPSNSARIAEPSKASVVSFRDVGAFCRSQAAARRAAV
jgi:hypothetical protein